MSEEEKKRNLASNLGELKKSGWRSRTVRQELRENLIERLKRGEKLFEGVYGYEKTVELQVINALLSEHNFILLGLRGQGKTKIVRQVANLLDDFVPVLADKDDKGKIIKTALNEDPLNPISPKGRRIIATYGDSAPIEWLSRETRYNEKLATPDVSIADLIGDIDPIKAAREKLDISNEEVIHWGIIPRSNRGIFAINELPDLQPRIQVGLFNILEENDIQVRGFPMRLPTDILLLFTANPEDYTNRGRIITPLKDRINSQIITHYPKEIAVARKITQQEANCKGQTEFSDFYRDIVEEIAIVSRKSQNIDPTSGVSQRLPISALEIISANIERRILLGKRASNPRVMDLYSAVPTVTGKIELIDEREQEELERLATSLIGQAIKVAFEKVYPSLGSNAKMRFEKDMHENEQTAPEIDSGYLPILEYFKSGKKLILREEMDDKSYEASLKGVSGLEKMAAKHCPEMTKLFAMELLVEGLFQNELINRKVEDGVVDFYDVYSTMLDSLML